MDLIEAQDRYAAVLEDVKLVIVLDDAARHRRRQHAAVVGADGLRRHQPAVVTKLADRGSGQTLGIVTDVACSSTNCTGRWWQKFPILDS